MSAEPEYIVVNGPVLFVHLERVYPVMAEPLLLGATHETTIVEELELENVGDEIGRAHV